MRRPDLSHSPLFMLLTRASADALFVCDAIAKPQIVTVWLCYPSVGCAIQHPLAYPGTKPRRQPLAPGLFLSTPVITGAKRRVGGHG